MINLNRDLSQTELDPYIVSKLQKIKITKLGHLVMSSYLELFYTHLFDPSELEAIYTFLKDHNLNYIDDIRENTEFIHTAVIDFAFTEYQHSLYNGHLKKYDKNKNEELRYSDSLHLVRFLYQLYKELYPQKIENFAGDSKVALSLFLQYHPNMSISTFIDINPQTSNADTIQLISEILGLPLNCELPYKETVKRENEVFNRKNITNDILAAYEELAKLSSEKLAHYLQMESENNVTKHKKI